MSCADLIKVERVLCDEVFIVRDPEENVPVGAPLPAGSMINPEKTNVNVTVFRCDLIEDQESDRILADLEFLIEKNILITRPELTAVSLRFSFTKEFNGLPVTNLRLSEVPVDFERIKCDVFSLKAEDDLKLDVAAGTFSEWLTITTIMKIVYIDQIPLPGPCPCPPTPGPCPCPPYSYPCPSPISLFPISSETISGLEILKGKIRAQICEPLKEELLTEVDKVLELFRHGRPAEAIAVLNSIGNELQEVLNKAPSRKIQIGLVFGDLVRVNQIINRAI